MRRKEEIKEHFGRQIQQLRLRQNLSIRTLAARSRLKYSQVQRIENGKANPVLTTIYGLAEGLDLPVADLFSELN